MTDAQKHSAGRKIERFTRLDVVFGGPGEETGGYLRRDLFLAVEAAARTERKRETQRQEEVEEPRRNVINWLHDKTVLVPIRCPLPDPPWLLLKIWGHATSPRTCARKCVRVREGTCIAKLEVP